MNLRLYAPIATIFRHKKTIWHGRIVTANSNSNFFSDLGPTVFLIYQGL